MPTKNPLCAYCRKPIKPSDLRMGFGPGTERAKKVSRGLSRKELVALDPNYGKPWFGKVFKAASVSYHWECAKKARLIGPIEKMVKKEWKRRRTVAGHQLHRRASTSPTQIKAK